MSISVTRCPDAHWHFTISVPNDSEVGTEEVPVPTPDQPFVKLARFVANESTVEVFGHLLPREIDPADYLEVWLAGEGVTISSARDISTDSGVSGDAVGSWLADGETWVGRFYATKWGNRLFIVSQRAPERRYPALAETFYSTMMSLAPGSPEGSPLAEDARHWGEEGPMPWRTIVPVSWILQPDSIHADLTSFRGSSVAIGKSARELLFGKLVLAMATKNVAPNPAALAGAFVDALSDRRVTVEPADLEEMAAPAGFRSAYSLVTRATLNRPPFYGVPCEVRARVLAGKSASFFAGVFGPTRETGAIAWMHNKRTLDLAIQHLEVGDRVRRSS